MYNELWIKKLLDEKVINNSEIYNFVKNHNSKQILDFDTQLLGGCGAVFGREDYVLMLQLGVPIGVVEHIDSEGNLLIDENEPIGKVKNIYKPINSLKEYFEYMEINPYPDVIVNQEYMTKKEVRNLAYCLEHSNNDLIFDFNTKNKIQLEIINSVPLRYKEAMKIFNKYFDKSIHKKFIYDYGVERNRFYYLSGLNELITSNKVRNTKEKEREDEFKL